MRIVEWIRDASVTTMVLLDVLLDMLLDAAIIAAVFVLPIYILTRVLP